MKTRIIHSQSLVGRVLRVCPRGRRAEQTQGRAETSSQCQPSLRVWDQLLQRFFWLHNLYCADLMCCSHCTEDPERKYLEYSEIANLGIFIIVLSF